MVQTSRDDVTATRYSLVAKEDIDPGTPLEGFWKRLLPDRVLGLIKTAGAVLMAICYQQPLLFTSFVTLLFCSNSS